MDAADLAAVVADTTTVRVTGVGALDANDRRASGSLVVVSDADAVAGLLDALAIDGASLRDEIALMTPGALDLHFFRGHDLRATVTYVATEYIRWKGWRFDARLRSPERLARWLKALGWSGRGAEFTPRSSPGSRF